MKFHRFISIAICILFFLSNVTVSWAIIITEVHPHPQDGPEWIELYNPDEETANLTGWTLYDQLSSPSLIYEFTETLEPESYTVFQLSSSKLNNSADGVILYNESGTQIDAMQYESSTIGKSWARKTLDSNAFVEIDPTPGEPNPAPSSPTPLPTLTPTSTPTPTPSPTPNNPTNLNFTIEEIHPCPIDGGDEYVIIKNNANESISLENWKIRDAQNNLRSLSGTIAPEASKKISWQQAILNNSGDEVFLETNTGAVAASESYNSCTKGESIFPQKPDNSSQTPEEKSFQETSSKNNQDTKKVFSTYTSTASATASTTALSSVYPLPDFSTTATGSNPSATTSTGQAIYTKPPPDLPSPAPFLNVILGGFCVSISGAVLWYEKKLHKIITNLA